MPERCLRRTAGAALLVLSIGTHVAAAQATGNVAPTGSFMGRDSLDARKETGTTSRARHQLHGVATWTIERDTLDLRPKFTIRLELPAPSPVTIVIRALDSLPPAPGRYSFFLASTGASHSRPATVNASVYAHEGTRSRSYLPFDSTFEVTSIRTEDGAPVVSGRLVLRASRYGDAPKVPALPDYVWLKVVGDFTAQPARERRPVVTVSESMQRDVLERALDGFGITFIGALNGDGAEDSTHTPALARAFLASRWHEALLVEHVEANATTYRVRLRGRFLPVICEQAPTELYPECTTLPAPVTTHGAGDIGGTVRGREPTGSKAEDMTVYLMPNPAPIRDGFSVLCTNRAKRDKASYGALDAKVRGLSMHDLDSTVQALVYRDLDVDDRENERLVASVAVRHAIVHVGGSFAFSDIPAGNYLLYVTRRAQPLARHWYLRVVVRTGTRTVRDVDMHGVNQGGWACEGPHPFPMIHEERR